LTGASLAAFAARKRSGKSLLEMSAELLREAGVLACVFGLLDGVIHGLAFRTAVVVFAVGAALIAAGVLVERRRT
jgi:hypothetical protein